MKIISDNPIIKNNAEIHTTKQFKNNIDQPIRKSQTQHLKLNPLSRVSQVYIYINSNNINSTSRYTILPSNNIKRNNSYDYFINISEFLEESNKTNYRISQTEKKLDIYEINNNLIENRKKTCINNHKITLKAKKKYQKKDFEVISLCGKGAYGTVLQVKLKNDSSNKNYAIKVIDIYTMLKFNKLYQIYLEAEILYELNNPFVVSYYGCFEQKNKVYLIMDYIPKGDFSTFLKMNYPLKEETIRFYSAEIVLFLEYLQSKKMVHRDLKPENIMLTSNYHLKVIDFATIKKIGYYYDKNEMKFKKDLDFDIEDNEEFNGSKQIINPDIIDDENYNEEFKKNLRKSFVGTDEYLSPEILKSQPAGYGADLWAFGVMLYQMYFGFTPFKSSNTYLTFKNIENAIINFPNSIENISISSEALDLITQILIKDEKIRLGAGKPGSKFDMSHLKKHPFFKGIDWDNLINIKVPFCDEFKFGKKKFEKKISKNTKKDNIENDKNVTVLKKGYLFKKSFWFHFNKKYFVLDSTPRIIYCNAEKTGSKKIISLGKNSQIFLITNDVFKLYANKMEYKFKSDNKNNASEWINAIRDAIINYGH